jgi:acetylornithine/N-succinyldiaminopimelate aminotransferase
MLAVPSACVFEPGEQGGTFSGNPVLAAAAHAVVDVVTQPAFLASVVRQGKTLAAALREVAAVVPHAEVRGRWLLLALVLPKLDTQAMAHARESGLLINAPQPHVLRFMPALNVTDADIDTGVDICAI